ncbi:MAG: hypothetical protein Q9198_003181 [Flavoplaca austrocitrina]
MVAIKHIIPFLAALAAALPHVPGNHDETALQARHINTPNTAPVALEKRVPPRSRIYWAPQGRMLFTIGLRISDEIRFDSIWAVRSINIAKQLTYNFVLWLRESSHPAANLAWPFEKIGGIFSKNGEPEFFGIGVQLKQQFANNADIQTLIDAFKQFGQQHEGLVKVVQRANDFFDPARIGAGGEDLKRSQEDFCPAETVDVLQYADDSDPQSELIRWAEYCSA